MRWKAETLTEKRDRLNTWRPWFAWRPVVIDGETVWLEKVYRRTKIYGPGPDGTCVYESQYADVMSVLKRNQITDNYDGLE